MPFLVKYLQDIPQNCSECPCSVHITPTEVYCNALQKHFTVTDKRPVCCDMFEYKETKVEIKDISILDKIKEELKVYRNKYSKSGLTGSASGISRSMDVIDRYLSEANQEKPNEIEEKYKPESCVECMYHLVNGLFDYCGFDHGMLLTDDNTYYEKQRDTKCPLN